MRKKKEEKWVEKRMEREGIEKRLIKIKNAIDNDSNEQKKIMDLADRYQNRYGAVTDKDLKKVVTI